MWEVKTLREVCEKVLSGGTPNTKIKDYYENGDVFWLKTKEILNNNIYHTETKITKLGLNNSSAKILPSNSVIIAMYGDGRTAGRVAINKVPMATNQACCNLIINNRIAEYRYVFYNLLSRYDEFVQLKSGGSQQNLNTKTISNLKIKVPPLSTQQKIADILSAYDELIENNNRRIEVLEQAAQQIYNEWFVRFRFPGYESTNFTKGIPEGWEIVKLGDVVEIGRGSSPRPIVDLRYFENGDIPWIKIADATASKMFITETKERVNEFGASFSRRLSPGSLILAASGTLGFPIFLGIEGCIHDGWLYFDNFKGISPQYLYYNLIALTERFNAFSYGAAIQNINTGIVKNTRSVLPPLYLQELFTDRMNIIHGQIQSLQKSNQNLIKQRDLLLPRLMNGKLEV